ncbi:hypothetical protein WR25_17151 [Diploscapter pachys]|uniref:Uncharacterized protein n=1 Tax=Diploscapter pachys TaxID=2018661 RepID=A0A2A2JH43_9BILA|nr:hypothetical protein WR25_17151 [Diploscapter pachys]
MKWAAWEWMQPSNFNGADNGVLHAHLMKTLMSEAREEFENCNAIWHKATDYDSYMAFVLCIRIYLGAKRLWPDQVRIYKRAHGWVRDGFITSEKWSERDFMIHGWKAQNIGDNGWESPFTAILEPSRCGASLDGWNYREEKRVSVEAIRQLLAAFENRTGNAFPLKSRIIPFLQLPDVGLCYPNCDEKI